jgi:hypothetical protein
MKKKEIESKFDEIVAFAGREKEKPLIERPLHPRREVLGCSGGSTSRECFIDTPVKRYSSGGAAGRHWWLRRTGTLAYDYCCC